MTKKRFLLDETRQTCSVRAGSGRNSRPGACLAKTTKGLSVKKSDLLFWTALTATAAIGAQAFAAPVQKGVDVRIAAPSAPAGFDVYLPLRNRADLERMLQAQHTPGAPEFHHWLTPDQFQARFGPSPDSMARVQSALRGAGLQVAATHSRTFHVAGNAGQVSRLLGTELRTVRSPSGATRMVAASRPVLPLALQREGAHIVAFTGIPHAQPMSVKKPDAQPDNRQGTTGSYYFTDLKQAYDYPAYKLPNTRPTDGTGVTVAVLMADLVFPDDVNQLFIHEQFTPLTGRPSPVVHTVLIDGGGVYNGYGSFEASLDVQQVLGGAPGAKVTLVSLPDLSDTAIMDGYSYIVDTNAYDIVNSSFGGCELAYTAAYNGGVDYTWILQMYHDIFAQGNAQGITFVASSGDQGGVSCPSVDYFYGGTSAHFVPSVEFPSDDPAVTGVGGGNLVTVHDGVTLDSTYVRESAYGDPRYPYDIYGLGANVSGGYWGPGGGRSVVFKRPAYQNQVITGSNYRTIPDVGMQVGGLGFSYNGAYCSPDAITCSVDDSSARTAYGVGLGGGFYRTIGTSVSSPEFVGALALYEQTAHRQGNVNTYLYRAGAAQTAAGGVAAPPNKQYYHRNIPGYDGAWADTYPSQNYNYINGNGTPDVRKLFGLDAYGKAGIPQTPSNP